MPRPPLCFLSPADGERRFAKQTGVGTDLPTFSNSSPRSGDLHLASKRTHPNPSKWLCLAERFRGFIPSSWATPLAERLGLNGWFHDFRNKLWTTREAVLHSRR